MRRRIKGFRVGLRISRWIFRINQSGYNRLNSTRPASSWGQRLTQSFRLFGSGYVKQSEPVPKGHLAVYVGYKDGDIHRVLVPIVHFNHPLFVELLRESEKEYGFRHEGGITIPCPYSDFERVKTRITSGSGSRIFPWSRLCRN